MRSDTKIEQNNFKGVIEKFAECMEFVTLEIDNSVKTCQQKVAEILEAAWIENALIFQIDDELIPGVDTPPTNKNCSSISESSIALNSQHHKQERNSEQNNV